MGKAGIKAVLDDDFEKLLRNLGKYDSVVLGKERCFFCDSPVTIDNIAMVFPYNGKVCFCCEKVECTDRLIESRDGCN